MDPRFVDVLGRFLRFRDGRPIEPDTVLRDFGLDSMHAIELLFALEDEFGVTLPDEHMTAATFATAGSLWTVVSGVLDADAPAGSA